MEILTVVFWILLGIVCVVEIMLLSFIFISAVLAWKDHNDSES